MTAGIADEVGIPRLEHVGASRAFGDAALLDLAHQLQPFLRYRSAIWQRRRVGKEPGAFDARRNGDFVEVACRRPAVGAGVEVTRDELGRDGAHRDRDSDQ